MAINGQVHKQIHTHQYMVCILYMVYVDSYGFMLNQDTSHRKCRNNRTAHAAAWRAVGSLSFSVPWTQKTYILDEAQQHGLDMDYI